MTTKANKTFRLSADTITEIADHKNQAEYIETLVRQRRARWSAVYAILTCGANGAKGISPNDLGACLCCLAYMPRGPYRRESVEAELRDQNLGHFVDPIFQSLGDFEKWFDELIDEYRLGSEELLSRVRA